TASAVTILAEPAAATMTSAWASSSSRLRVPVWVSVTVALCSRRVSRAPIDRPTVTPRPITTPRLPLRSITLRVFSSKTPRGVRGVAAGYQPAVVRRMLPVGVVGRIDGLEDGVGVDMGRQRQLDDVTGAGVVLVELVDDGQQLVLRHRLRQITPDRVDAHLCA